jgi:S-(hydroxymethyl)glutathione dehydrogenase/alcohol dehydrogenase
LRANGEKLFQTLQVGTFATRTVVHESAAIRIPDGVPPEQACLIGCAVATGVCSVLETARVWEGARVGVIGCGAVGLSAVQGARIAGASRIIASDPVASRRGAAAGFGATDVLDPTAEDVVARVRELTSGRGADRVLEAVGSAPTIETAIELVRPGGMIVVIGVASTAAEVRLRPHELFAREATIHFSYIRAFEFGRSVALLASLDLAPLLTHRFPLDHAAEALQAASSRAGVKVQLQPALLSS